MNLSYLQEVLGGYILADVVLLLIAGGVYWIFSRVVLTRLTPHPATLHQPRWRQALQGLAFAGIALLLSIVPVWVGGGFSAAPGWQAYAYTLDLTAANALLVWLFFAAQSLAEELMFRAIGLALLAILIFWLVGWLFAPIDSRKRQSFISWLWFGSGTLANIIVAIAFAYVHAGNENVTLLGLINVALAGVVLGQLFWLHGTPIGAWMLHLLWNAGLATFGLPISGYALIPPMLGLGFVGARDGILTGGSFGPEGSIVCSIALALIWGSMLRMQIAGMKYARNNHL